MADEKIVKGWKEAEKLLTKGKTNGALDILREIDPDGKEATTLRLAGQATFMQAAKDDSRSAYRKAAKLLSDSLKINPKFEDAIKNLYLVYLKKKHFKDLLIYARKLVEIDTLNAEHTYKLAYALELNNNLDESIKYYNIYID